MTTQRRMQERTRRKEDILLAARAEFAESGFRRATMEAVAERAELGKGTLYLYFPSKDVLLVELLLRATAQLRCLLDATHRHSGHAGPVNRLRALAATYLDFSLKSPDYFQLVAALGCGEFDGRLSGDQQRRLLADSQRALDLVTMAVIDGMAEGVFAPGDAASTAGVLWAALSGVLTYGNPSDPGRHSISDLYQATLDLLLRGLANARWQADDRHLLSLACGEARCDEVAA